MILIGSKILADFQHDHADARSAIESWVASAKVAEWKLPQDVREEYPKVSIIGSQQAVFDICGSKYRLWVHIDYENQIVDVQKIGTHKEYDKWKIK